MKSLRPARRRRRPAILTALLVAGAAAPLALAASPPVKGGHYRGLDTAHGTVTLTVSTTGANFTSGRFNLTLLGPMGRGSCAGAAHVTLGPSRKVQIGSRGTFDLSGTFPFREPSSDPLAFRGTAHAVVHGSFSDGGKRVSGTVELTASESHLTCRSGIVHFTATLV